MCCLLFCVLSCIFSSALTITPLSWYFYNLYLKYEKTGTGRWITCRHIISIPATMTILSMNSWIDNRNSWEKRLFIEIFCWSWSLGSINMKQQKKCFPLLHSVTFFTWTKSSNSHWYANGTCLRKEVYTGFWNTKWI